MNEGQVFSSPEIRESYESLTHESGLRVLISEKHTAATYAMLGVRYGAASVPSEMPHGLPAGSKTPLGVAHFLEHKMFEEADGTSCDLRFSELGAEVNAYTSYDRTVYYISCTHSFKEALTELLTMVKALRVSRASVSRERSIIAEEIRMNDDSPFERCYAELIRAMYQKCGIREEICGTEASVKEITPALLKAHFDAFYRPENMVLAVSGGTTIREIMSVVDECFGDVSPAGKTVALYKPQEPPLPDKTYTGVAMQVPKPLFCIGVKDGNVPTDPRELFRRDLCMTVLSEMLFSRSGDFYNDLFEAEIITPTYAYGSSAGEGYGYFAISGEADDPRSVYDRFCTYIDEVRAKGLSSEDFERSRRILYADYVTGFDAPEDVAQSLLTYAMDGIGLFDFIPTVQSLTLGEITELFEACFTPERYVLSVVKPFES